MGSVGYNPPRAVGSTHGAPSISWAIMAVNLPHLSNFHAEQSQASRSGPRFSRLFGAVPTLVLQGCPGSLILGTSPYQLHSHRARLASTSIPLRLTHARLNHSTCYTTARPPPPPPQPLCFRPTREPPGQNRQRPGFGGSHLPLWCTKWPALNNNNVSLSSRISTPLAGEESNELRLICDYLIRIVRASSLSIRLPPFARASRSCPSHPHHADRHTPLFQITTTEHLLVLPPTWLRPSSLSWSRFTKYGSGQQVSFPDHSDGHEFTSILSPGIICTWLA